MVCPVSIKKFLILAATLLCTYQFSIGQEKSHPCVNKKFLDDCFALLDGYTYIKTYKINVGKPKKNSTHREVGFTAAYYFSRGTTYMITVCYEQIEGDKMIVNLLDRNRKLVASSYSKRLNMHFSKLSYHCTSSGAYFIKAEFPERKGGCGMFLLGFKK